MKTMSVCPTCVAWSAAVNVGEVTAVDFYKVFLHKILKHADEQFGPSPSGVEANRQAELDGMADFYRGKLQGIV